MSPAHLKDAPPKKPGHDFLICFLPENMSLLQFLGSLANLIHVYD